MAISIRARLRNSMVGLSLALCLVFTIILFMVVFTTEDRVFINQLSAEQNAYENHQLQFPGSSWVSSSKRVELIKSTSSLPAMLPDDYKKQLLKATGIHEYFDSQTAYFISHIKHSSTGESQFLIYDVSDLLAVRGNKLPIFMMIIVLTLIVTIGAVLISYRLVNRTLEPVKRFSHELQNNNLDDVVIDLANEFSEDEIGVLTHELAIALGRARDATKREFEFNRGVSHELRSPIQVAQSATELLELSLEESESEQVSNYIKRLKRSTAEMNEIAEAFLWLASDRDVEQNDVYSVAQLNETVASVQATYPITEIVTASSLPVGFIYPLPVKVGAVIVRNLLRNAVSHGENKAIHIELKQDRILVRNHTNHHGESMQSFGIGLSIVQRICERFNCRLSTSQNRGTSYEASIVFKPQHAKNPSQLA